LPGQEPSGYSSRSACQPGLDVSVPFIPGRDISCHRTLLVWFTHRLLHGRDDRALNHGP
jgi:hypothetical protein